MSRYLRRPGLRLGSSDSGDGSLLESVHILVFRSSNARTCLPCRRVQDMYCFSQGKFATQAAQVTILCFRCFGGSHLVFQQFFWNLGVDERRGQHSPVFVVILSQGIFAVADCRTPTLNLIMKDTTLRSPQS